MPKIDVYKFFTFFIFSYDGLNEPPHLHIAKEKGKRQRSAKIWLKTLEVANKGSLLKVKQDENAYIELKKYFSRISQLT